jgi:hypothetical protein
MKKQTITKILTTIAVCSFGFISCTAYAGLDSAQRDITQRFMQAKQKLQQAEATKGVERQKLIDEHMKMM